MITDTIPSIDLSDFQNGNKQEKDDFIELLGRAYEEIGFVAVKNHLLTPEIQQKLHQVSIDFFALPENQKSSYEIEGNFGQRGYTGKEKEHAAGRNVGDLKEFYHVGNDDYGKNVWPQEITEFKEVTETAYRQLEETGLLILRAIALHLGLEEDHFENKARGGNSILRLIHYYPIEDVTIKEGSVRAAEHGDINLITLLMGASAEGLELKRKDGVWVPVTTLPGHLVVNVGDMLSRYTNDKLTSTIHRVINPAGSDLSKPRYSIPFFLHPRPEMDLSCLETCINEKSPKKYEDITANEFLEERLRDIGLKS